MRTATAQVSSHRLARVSIISRISRVRFSTLPPYSSLRRLRARREELERQIIVPGIDIDDVSAGPPGPRRGVVLPAAGSPGCRALSMARAEPGTEIRPLPGRRQRRLARQTVVGVEAAMPELDAHQAAMGMDGIGRWRQRPHIVFVPKRQIAKGKIVRRRMNGAIFGANHAPAAFRLDAAQRGRCLRRPPAHTGRMRRLVESVRRGDRPDPHRLEQNIVAGIAHGHFLVERLYNKGEALCNPSAARLAPQDRPFCT